MTEGKDVITEIESSDTLDSCDREDTKHDMIMTINIYPAKCLSSGLSHHPDLVSGNCN